MRFRLLALDVDGTLTDPDGRLRPIVAERVLAARSAGLRVVLCTGRRYRTSLPLIEALGLEGPVVLHNGVIVKDATSGSTLEHAYLPGDVYAEALAIMRGHGSPLVYVDRYHDEVDMLCEPPDRAHPFQAEYLEDNTRVAHTVESLDAQAPEGIVLMSCMGDEPGLYRLRDEIEGTLAGRVRTNFLMNKNYRGFILEVVSSTSGKWPALQGLAERDGIARHEIVAIGDDNNDLEMIEHAGLGIAMGNAIEAVKRVADHVTASNDEDGLARAIERFVL